MSDLVFVYGTLKRGGPCEEVLVHSGGRYVCDSVVTGVELYLLPVGFPAAVLDPTGTAIAKGEIWSVKTLWGLDQLEGDGIHYKRIQMTFPTNGGDVTAWIYIYLLEERLAYAMPLVTGMYPTDDGEAQNLVMESAHYHGWQTPFGCNGFDEYEKDNPNCYMDCDTCPYNYNQGCEYSDDFDLTNG